MVWRTTQDNAVLFQNDVGLGNVPASSGKGVLAAVLDSAEATPDLGCRLALYCGDG
jgi:hypothetical protein